MAMKRIFLIGALVLSALTLLTTSGCAQKAHDSDYGYGSRTPDGGRSSSSDLI